MTSKAKITTKWKMKNKEDLKNKCKLKIVQLYNWGKREEKWEDHT